MIEIPVERLRALFDYDPATGELRWKVPAGRHGRIPAGSIAGTTSGEGYKYVVVDGVHCRASRVIWAMMTGEWPAAQVDHEDRNPGNDRWTNLRLATGAQNKANNAVYRNNTSGYPGVYWDKEREHWRAKGVVNGKRQWLGRFQTAEDAYAAYCENKKKEYGEHALIVPTENELGFDPRMLDYSPEWLRAAADYLEDWQKRHAEAGEK